MMNGRLARSPQASELIYKAKSFSYIRFGNCSLSIRTATNYKNGIITK